MFIVKQIDKKQFFPFLLLHPAYEKGTEKLLIEYTVYKPLQTSQLYSYVYYSYIVSSLFSLIVISMSYQQTDRIPGNRKIIQISSSTASIGEGGNDATITFLFALCEDGSIWKKVLNRTHLLDKWSLVDSMTM